MKMYVRAMALPKQEAIRRANSYSLDIVEHTIKLVLYSDIRPDDAMHWVEEIASWLRYVGKITIKPSNKKLKPSDLENTVFSWAGDDLYDYEALLEEFQRNNARGKFNYADKESYPEIEVTASLASDLMDVSYSMIDSAIPLMTDKQEHSKQDYIDALVPVFKNYL